MRSYIRIAILLFIGRGIISCSNEDANGYIERGVDLNSYVDVAEKQLRFGTHCVDSAYSTTENQEKKSGIPISIDKTKNVLIMGNSVEWTSGFFPGSCWIMYELTREKFWEEKASQYTWFIADAASRSQHDLGFMFNNSFGRAYKMTKDDSYKEVLLTAARTLSGRYNEKIGCLQSWGMSERWNFPVIIDAMMNMELMFKATEMTGDSTYWKMAVSHADKTMKNHFRTDYSSYHVVSYYQSTGEVQCKQTSQGYSDESFWSRGQTWGLYGFTMCYRYTRDAKYLNQAIHIADFLLGLDYNDYIPYWDMACPDIPNTPKDASAGAIMASALLELCRYVDGAKANEYKDFAIKQISNLHDSYSCSYGTNFGFVLDNSVGSYPVNYQISVPTVYADYYYLEALARLRECE